MSADKISAQHRARKAVLYVRQSSAHQVQYNRESQVLQYATRDRLVQLGWSDVVIIDEDLGCSAAGGTPRAGLERMVAEVCLGKVGAVAAEAQTMARRDEAREALVRDLKAAQHTADRTFRQYDAADPENRFVAGELETRWNCALTCVA